MVNLKTPVAALLAAMLLVSCDDSNPVEPAPTPEKVTITVMGANSSPLEGAKVTCLENCTQEQVETTDESGQVTLTGFEPLNVRVEKPEYTTVEKEVYNGHSIVLTLDPADATITVVDQSQNPIEGAKITCLVGCDGPMIRNTNQAGQATLTGAQTLTVRAEKQGLVTIEKEVSDGDTLSLKLETTGIVITVVDSLTTDPIEGSTVSCLNGCSNQQVEITDTNGEVTLDGVQSTVTIRVEKPGYVTVEREVSSGDTVALQLETESITITVVDSVTTNPLEGATVTCLNGCASQQVEITDTNGEVTLDGIQSTVTIRVEKPGYVTVEREVSSGDVISLARAIKVITITVLDSLSGDPVEWAIVTCLNGCINEQSQSATDPNGRALLVGIEPMTVRAEKRGFTTVEQEVYDGDTILIVKPLADVTITVYPVGGSPQGLGIEGVLVSCLEGCDPVGQTAITDGQGKVTLNGFQPLTVRAEKIDFLTVEEEGIFDGGGVRLPHEWPSESAGSFARLNLPVGLVLNWGDPTGLLLDSDLGSYGCSQIIVGKRADGDRRRTLCTMEHEFMHAHQDETVKSGRCSQIGRDWVLTPDGLDWIAATEADIAAGRIIIPQIDNRGRPWHEQNADAYELWTRACKSASIPDICYNGQSERCRWFEDRFGPRPPSYP